MPLFVFSIQLNFSIEFLEEMLSVSSKIQTPQNYT